MKFGKNVNPKESKVKFLMGVCCQLPIFKTNFISSKTINKGHT
jgi:hypothetical protein